ncbi:CAAX protease self-immunity [Paenibacillus algorifonticola]|uniref:CAAX protease self-immunity n=1 Tax=Paenibacillus algorifonticola TaxID=684063 RepID=A0A1I2IIZ7_9BACL|nr:CPBP family intramembrane glutamic endopeptidase [Paenibacillus algorifonticola]SFF42319.1 CAAX protease self-immunity [Paenibacillus algorifonticola]
MVTILFIVAAIIGLVLFIKNRPRSYPSILMPKDQAIAVAADYLQMLCGLDVSGWRAYGMYWNDRETVNRLHHLNMLDRLRSILYQWGLVESWRIRFVNQGSSVAVGINAKGEITFLHVDAGAQRLSSPQSLLTKKTPAEIKTILDRNNNGLWGKAKTTGEGIREEDLSDIVTYWYMLESDEIRMKLSVQTQDNCIVRILSETDILTETMGKVVRQEFRDSALNLSGFVGSFLSTIAGVLLLIYVEGSHNSMLSLGIGLAIAAAVLLTVNNDISMSIVNAFDSRLTIKSVYTIGIVSAVVASIAYGSMAFITSLAGLKLAAQQSLLLFNDALLQITIGCCSALAALGVFAYLFKLLESRGVVRISPELSDRSIFLSGFRLKQCLSISLQSSILEEIVFRLLGISTLLWFFQNEWLAVAITSILWAFLHQGSGYNPGWIRWGQLVVFGIFLGFIFIHYGFLAVVVAHFVHNFVLLFIPILYYKLQLRSTIGVKAEPAPHHSFINK